LDINEGMLNGQKSLEIYLGMVTNKNYKNKRIQGEDQTYDINKHHVKTKKEKVIFWISRNRLSTKNTRSSSTELCWARNCSTRKAT
jgi:hypothetical protein